MLIMSLSKKALELFIEEFFPATKYESLLALYKYIEFKKGVFIEILLI